jgi:serine/threonine protein kinase
MTYQELTARYQHDPKKPIRFGGQGAIFKALDINRGIYVALKRAQVTHRNTAQDKYSVYKEFDLGLNMSHPNLAKYYDAYRIDTGMGTFDFGVMEFIEGGTNIDDYLKTFPDEPEIKKVLVGLLEGLKYLHSHRIIHRDIKPNNILIDTSSGEPVAKIIDFGVSKALSSAETVASAIVGTFEYMAPEQINPKPGEKMRYNLDLWGIGVIVYKIFTGYMPFGSVEEGHTREIIQNKILDAVLPSKISSIPEPYKTLIRKCLVKDVNQRIKTADEALEILRMPTAKPSAKPTTPQKKYTAPTSKSSSKPSSSLIYLLVILLLSVFILVLMKTL